MPTGETELEMKEIMDSRKKERIYDFEIPKELRDECKGV
jgi:hypothetical protein